MSRWSPEITYKFVEEYIRHECLWNVTSETYKNKAMRQGAYAQIVRHMEIEGFGEKEVVQKIKNVRSTFSQEKKKILDSRKAGISESDVHHPTLKWFQMLDNALKNLPYHGRRTPQSCDAPDDSGLDFDGMLIKEENNSFEDETPSPVYNENYNTLPAPSSLYVENYDNRLAPSILTQRTVLPPYTERYNSRLHARTIPPRRIEQKRRFQTIKNIVADLKGLTRTLQMPDHESEFLAFGRNIGLQLECMPLPLALEAQAHIQSYLTQLRLREFQQPTSEETQHSVASLVTASFHSTPPFSPAAPDKEN